MTLEELKAHKAYLSKKMQECIKDVSDANDGYGATMSPEAAQLAGEIQKDFDTVNEQIKLKI